MKQDCQIPFYKKTSSQVLFIVNGVPHIMCSYLKILIPISKFRSRITNHIRYLENLSKPGDLARLHNSGKQKPRKVLNKEIDGKIFRFCYKMNKYMPIEDFSKSRNKKYYRNISNTGRKIENRENKDKINKAIKNWKLKNKHKISAYNINRRIIKHKYSKKFKNILKDEIIKIYSKRNELNSLLLNKKDPYEVHHIFPLKIKDKNKKIIGFGLHCAWNLMILPKSINLHLSNNLPTKIDVNLLDFLHLQTEYTKMILNRFYMNKSLYF